MNKWQETVKRISKLHPGKSLKTILPLAKVEYKKMGHSSSTKKVEKLSKPSRARRSTRGIRKGRKAKKPKKMKGGENCSGHESTEHTTSDHYEPFTGGSHCNTAKGHKKKRKPRKSKRRPRKPKKMKGGQCSDSCSGCSP